MKAEFELQLPKDSFHPEIQFRHFDKSRSIEQQILGIFIEAAGTRGLRIERTAQFADIANRDADNNSYKIVLGNEDVERENKVREVFRWLLGHGAEVPQTPYPYSWRSILQEKLEEIGFDLGATPTEVEYEEKADGAI